MILQGLLLGLLAALGPTAQADGSAGQEQVSLPIPTLELPAESSLTSTADEAGGRWVAKKSDSVCGLSDPRQVSKPAKIDYKKVLEKTPSMKKLKKDGIDPKSPEGIRLRTKAQDELKKAANKVRQAKGHCSVWKKIRHTDGRAVTDLTQAVIAEL